MSSRAIGGSHMEVKMGEIADPIRLGDLLRRKKAERALLLEEDRETTEHLDDNLGGAAEEEIDAA